VLPPAGDRPARGDPRWAVITRTGIAGHTIFGPVVVSMMLDIPGGADGPDPPRVVTILELLPEGPRPMALNRSLIDLTYFDGVNGVSIS